ncbi:MAG: hypothetical protein FWF90_12505 [Promicromonosporaceae bacterium]|nr:hypothetical protein [Promicromonosporaceae bacterium]
MDDDDLRTRIARAVEGAQPDLADRLTDDPAAHLDLVALHQAATVEAAALLSTAIGSARHAGCTWEQIGAVLGMTRQAAQQRYGPSLRRRPAFAGRQQAVFNGLTAFNEIAALNRAGRYGWHSVGYGLLHHVVERDEVQWEHARTKVGVVPFGEGWRTIGSGWGWWTYWARPLDVPVLPGDPAPNEFLRG